mmetsp:Transcript_84937/g.274562  ORF Transcript_84937/g.274562 Transcript_84937/m.274562 type:complete len:207 (+) Transcript_84937:92-712(+)
MQRLSCDPERHAPSAAPTADLRAERDGFHGGCRCAGPGNLPRSLRGGRHADTQGREGGGHARVGRPSGRLCELCGEAPVCLTQHQQARSRVGAPTQGIGPRLDPVPYPVGQAAGSEGRRAAEKWWRRQPRIYFAGGVPLLPANRGDVLRGVRLPGGPQRGLWEPGCIGAHRRPGVHGVQPPQEAAQVREGAGAGTRGGFPKLNRPM